MAHTSIHREHSYEPFFFLSLSVPFFVIALFLFIFLCHCPTCYLFFYVIARLDRAIYFFSPALNVIALPFSPLSLPRLSLPYYPRHPPLSVITRLDRVISLPLPPIFRMPRSSRSIHLLLTSSQQLCLGFLYSVMPRLDRGISRLFLLSPIASPAGSSQTGQSEFARSA